MYEVSLVGVVTVNTFVTLEVLIMYMHVFSRWYHGSISRVDAENLLRVHKEGSYLVRMSESNKMDYSLSLK